MARLAVLVGVLLLPACAQAPDPGPADLASLDPARLVDLSYPFDERTVYWPTAQPFRLIVDSQGRAPGGFWYASNRLCASEHGGTHLDAPFHFAEQGFTTERIPLGALIGLAIVIDVRAACAADPDHAATL